MDYRGIIENEARKNGVRVYYHDRGAQWGRSDLDSKRIFVPAPHRFPSFFTGLHEIGHIASNHHSWDGKPEYVWEFEAFEWALNCCRDRGMSVPERTVKYERSIIAEKVVKATKRGLEKIEKRVVKFVKEGADDDPDVVFVKKNVADDGRVTKTPR